MAGASDWDQFCARRDRLQLPLRPDAAIAARLARLVEGKEARVLMLGLTPELAGIGDQLTVADWNPQMLERAWPEGRSRDDAVLADWREMRFAPGSFSAVIGDGSLSALSWPQDHKRLFARIAPCLETGGRLAVRCFVAPDDAELLDNIAARALAGGERSFHALKWRLAMALAAGNGGNVAVTEILAAFAQCFPDRAALCCATGWSAGTIGEIDSYRDAATVFSFVTRSQLLAGLPDCFTGARFAISGDYPLSERCPFLVAERC